ncbi:CBS domain-containing protein CBSCBSPB3 [Carex littledalei]|uniref:CBS domain-containing protein CBSCBSPB3 n=1 Tax=Carex littledalei TaxID=544730 RepID=A0A833R2D2_9POAL|nr:CBS domain-containing protein CBSCBSPB3 [Carex littledalei]
MTTHGVTNPKRTSRRPPTASRRSDSSTDGGGAAAAITNGKPPKPISPKQTPGERTVKKLRLSKALTIPEGTTVSEACRRMATRRIDSVLLTDSNGLLSGIVTDKDIATRVVAEGLRPEQTFISKIMTRNPMYVMADTLAIDALQKMVNGKFRHLPVVENGEVIAMLDIAKCLYDAISRLEKAAEHGSAIAAAVEGVERQFGSNFTAPHAFVETLREKMFKPSLSTIVNENTKLAVVSPSDPVSVAAKRMREFRVNSVVVVTGNTLHGIFTSKDLLMRVVAMNMSPELTLVDKVMTVNPDCASLETTILDALHILHDGKFLHIPVLDGEGQVVACLDVLQLTHASISMVDGGADSVNDAANTIMHKFWDSAFALEPPEEYDNHSELSASMMASENADSRSTYPPLFGNSFSFKLEDKKGRVHRFNSGLESLDELVSTVASRVGIISDQDKIQLLYDDDEGDRVLLTTDSDLANAVSNAKSLGQKVLRLHIDDSDSKTNVKHAPNDLKTVQNRHQGVLTVGLIAGTVAVTGVAVMFYLKRTNL